MIHNVSPNYFVKTYVDAAIRSCMHMKYIACVYMAKKIWAFGEEKINRRERERERKREREKKRKRERERERERKRERERERKREKEKKREKKREK